jgi:Integrase core domain
MRYVFPSVQSSCSYDCAWRSTASLQDTERTKRCLAQSRSMWRGQRWPRISWSLCRTVCLHYVATISGDKVPLPLGTQLHATKPNEILHFDFLYIGLSTDWKHQYLLLFKDDLSGYLWLVPCRTADATATVDALMRWFAVFDVVLIWISDRGSHFKNEVVQRVQKELKAKHHFTAAN